MSGFAICVRDSGNGSINAMMEKISHRGNYIQSVCSNGNVVLGQNYLQADTRGAKPDAAIPVADNGLAICYDGQINDSRELCKQMKIEDGPFLEERLILHLYQNHKDDMFQYLGNAIFSFVITDGKTIFAARDLLGIKTLFYSIHDDRLLITSELKSLAAVTDDIREFPSGYVMDENASTSAFGELSSHVEYWDKDIDVMTGEIRAIIKKHIRSAVDFERPTGGLLSGGMDSSVINTIGSQLYKKKFGDDGKLQTFSIGVGESGDIKNARLMADFIGSDHHEIQITIHDLLKAMPDVIYHLESFDPSLVRSSVANYLISSFAAKERGIEILLSGEGGDEIFCGYTYLKKVPYKNMVQKQLECLGFLHNNASLRLDRMNQCNSVKVVAPLISGELLNYALRIPPQLKQKEQGDSRIEKWIFRKAYEGILPKEITSRTKQEFSQGSGAAGVLPEHFEKVVSDSDFAALQQKFPIVRSKEEYYYFKLFTEYFGEGKAVDTVGQWISL